MKDFLKGLSLKKAMLFLGGASLFWAGISELLPPDVYNSVSKVLAALTVALAYMLNPKKSENGNGQAK